jgi:hypothetical protein
MSYSPGVSSCYVSFSLKKLPICIDLLMHLPVQITQRFEFGFFVFVGPPPPPPPLYMAKFLAIASNSLRKFVEN